MSWTPVLMKNNRNNTGTFTVTSGSLTASGSGSVTIAAGGKFRVTTVTGASSATGAVTKFPVYNVTGGLLGYSRLYAD